MNKVKRGTSGLEPRKSDDKVLYLTAIPLSSTTAIGPLTLLRLVELWALHRIHPFTWKYTKPLLAGVATFTVCFLANKFIFDWHTVAVLLVGAVVFVSVYAASLYLLRLDETDREVLAAVRRKLARGFF